MNRPDENKERGNWSGKFDFILSCIGYAVGLGNVWRFPFLAYRNGGGAFYIPYWIMLIFIGMPILFMEMSLGQFVSLSSAKAWRFARLFMGLGLAQAMVSFYVGIYYNMIIAWSCYYFFASFTKLPGLPWDECREPWATPFCMTNLNLTWNGTFGDCQSMGYTPGADGVCYSDASMETPYSFYNYSLAKDSGKQAVVPTQDYLNNFVLKRSSGMEDTGTPDWKLVLALLFAWILVFLCMIRGIKSSGRVVYFTATFPYVILLILLIRGVLLPGVKEGILFYVEPDVSRLNDIKVWRDAAVQLFFSLSASWGGLITLSSYNRFHNNTLRDALIVSLADTLTSMFAGCVIFSYIGFLSHELDVDVEGVFEGGTTLAFQVYPYAVTLLPVSPLWAILFFFMLVILGMDSQFVMVETVLSSVLDVWTSLRPRKTLVLLVLCVIWFILGLTLTCPGGVYWLDLMDTYAGGWNLMFVAICECIAIFYVYGYTRFTNDIRTMIGDRPCLCPWSCCKWWWAPLWGFITPLGVAALVIYTWYKWERGYWPLWGEILGWLMLMGVIAAVLVTGIVMLIRADGNSCSEKWHNVTTPPEDWGPALVEHRRLVTYVPGFNESPWGDVEKSYDDGEKGFSQF